MKKIRKGDPFPVYEKDGNFFFSKNAPQGAKSYTPDVDDYVGLANALTSAVEHNIPMDPSAINALAGKVSDAFKMQYKHFATRHSQISGISFNDFMTQHSQPGGEYYQLGKEFISQVLNSDVDVKGIASVKVGSNTVLADLIPGFRNEAGEIVQSMKLKDLRNTVASSLVGPVASAASVSGLKGHDPSEFMSSANLGILEAFPTYDRYRYDEKGKRIEQSFLSHSFLSGRKQVTNDLRSEKIMNAAEQAYFEATHHGDFSDVGISVYDPHAAQTSVEAINRINSGITGGVNSQSAIDIIRKKVANSPIAQAADPTSLDEGINSVLNILRSNYGQDSLAEVVQIAETDGLHIPGLGQVGGNPIPYDSIAEIPERPWYWQTIDNLPRDTKIPTSLHYDPAVDRNKRDYFYPTRKSNAREDIYEDGNLVKNKGDVIFERVNPNSKQLKVTRDQLENFYTEYDARQANLPEGKSMPQSLQRKKETYDKVLRSMNKASSGADRPLPDVPGNLEQWSVMSTEVESVERTDPDLEIVADRGLVEINTGVSMLNKMHREGTIKLTPNEIAWINTRNVTVDDVRSIAKKHDLNSELDVRLLDAKKIRDYKHNWEAPVSNNVLHEIAYPAAQRAAYYEALEGGLQGGYTNELAVKMLVQGQKSLGYKGYKLLAEQHGVAGVQRKFYKAISKLGFEEGIVPPTEGTRYSREKTLDEINAEIDAGPPPPDDPYSVIDGRGSSGGNPPPDDPGDEGTISSDGRRPYRRRKSISKSSTRRIGMHMRPSVSDVGNQEGENMIPGYDFDDLSIPEGSKWTRPYHDSLPYEGQVEFIASRKDGKIIWTDKRGREFEHGSSEQGYYGSIANPQGETIWSRSQAEFDRIYQEKTGQLFNPTAGDSVRKRGLHKGRKAAYSNAAQPDVVVPNLDSLTEAQQETNNILRQMVESMQSGQAPVQGAAQQSWGGSQQDYFDYMAANPTAIRDDVDQRIAAMSAARKADPNNPFISLQNPAGEVHTDAEKNQLWRARTGFNSMKDRNRLGQIAPFDGIWKDRPDFQAFKELQVSNAAYEQWRDQVGENTPGDFSNTDAEFIRLKAGQWTNIKNIKGIQDDRTGVSAPAPIEDVRDAIIQFDPSAADDPEKLNRYYGLYADSTNIAGAAWGTNARDAAYGYTDGWSQGDVRNVLQDGVREREQRLSAERKLYRDQGMPLRRIDYNQNVKGLRAMAIGQMDISALNNSDGVAGKPEFGTDASGNTTARMVNESGQTLVSSHEVNRAQSTAIAAFASATDPSKPMPMNTRDAMATVKTRMSDFVNAEIKNIEQGMEKGGFTDTEIKAVTSRFKSVFETFSNKATDIFQKSLSTLFDDGPGNSYKDRSFVQYKSVPVNSKNLEEVMRQNPNIAKIAYEQTGMTISELSEAGTTTNVTDPNSGTAYAFGKEAWQPGGQGLGGVFSKGNARSILRGAMMMRYAWRMAGEPTMRQSQEFGESMEGVGVAAAIGKENYDALGGVGGSKARRAIYKQYMGQGANEVYGGFAETPGLIGGGGAFPRVAAYAGPAAGIFGGTLALGGSMGALGGMAEMPGITNLGRTLPIAGAVAAGALMVTGAGFEMYNQAHPDQAPLSIGSVYRDTLQDIKFAKTYDEFNQERMDKIVANSEYSYIPNNSISAGRAMSSAMGNQVGVSVGQLTTGIKDAAALGRAEWDNNPEFRNKLIRESPADAAGFASSDMTPEEMKIKEYANALGGLSGEGPEGGLKGVLKLAGFVGADDIEKFFDIDNFTAIAETAKKTGMSVEDVITAAGQHASSYGMRRGTSGFTDQMLDFVNQEPGITEIERLLDQAAKRGQYGSQLQYMMGRGEEYSGLGLKLTEQYQPVSHEVQYAQQIGSAVQRNGTLSPSGWSNVMQIATNSNAMQVGAISSIISAPGMGDMMGGGNVSDRLAQLGVDLSGAGMSDQQAFILDRAAGGDLQGTSFYSHMTGNDAYTQYYDKFGYFAGRRDGMTAFNLFDKFLNNSGQQFADWRQLYGGDFSHISTADPTAFAASITGSQNPEIQQAFLDKGIYGLQVLQQKKSAENSLASAGIAMAGVNLQRDYLWGSGSWDKPAEGSMYYLEDRMRALQHSSQMEGFDDQWTRLTLSNQYATQSERIQENRMYASHNFNNWTQSFNYNMQQQQQSWMQQDWGYQDQMRSLSQGWAAEDLDEAIRFSSGRERRKLVRQKERTAVSTNLEDEQIGDQRERQKELWAAEEERYQKNMDYQKELQSLDVENFELGKQQRQEFFQLDVESFERRKADYLEQKELQDEMQEKQREHQAAQLDLQAASAGLQAQAAAQQIEIAEAILNAEEPITDMQKSIELMNQYDLAFKNMEMLQATLNIINDLAIDKVAAAGGLFESINDINVQKLINLRNILVSLINIGD